MTMRGLLLTMTEPPAAMEEEFNAWYDAEHLPERLAIAGFRAARRWVSSCAPGEGKYLATYELDSAGVLQSPAYLERFANATPTGTSVGKARSTGRASSASSSTILTSRDRRPRLRVPVPAARAFAAQSAPG